MSANTAVNAEPTQRWTDEYFERMSQIADPSADQVVGTIFQQHGLKAVNDIMANLVTNDALDLTGLPSDVQSILHGYLESSAKLPPWADMALLNRGSDVFAEHGPEIVMVLFGASLPMLYAAPDVAHVLTMTHRMSVTKYLERRIVETAQFVIDVTALNGFSGTGFAIRTTQKVRLMHAAIRHLILHDSRVRAAWEGDQFPIDQVDLAGTMLTFSITILDGLKKMNITLSAADQEAYLHLWKVVGHVLGIQDELMPRDVPDAQNMFMHWIRRYHAETEGGRQLTKVLLVFIRSKVPGPILQNLLVTWVRYWLGTRTANLLHVPRFGPTLIILHVERAIFGILDGVGHSLTFLWGFNRTLSRALVNGLLEVERGGNRPQFRIPDSLRYAKGMKHRHKHPSHAPKSKSPKAHH